MLSTSCSVVRKVLSTPYYRVRTNKILVIPLINKATDETVRNQFILDMNYLESVNEDVRNSVRVTRRRKRHIGFFGTLSELDKRVGVKLVFPF